MPRHRFTLAALATLAVPGLDVAATRTFSGGGDGQHDAALVTDRSGGDLVVRVPATRDAALRLETESLALRALTAGARSRLPFAVPSLLGTVPAPRTVVTSYLPGTRLQPAGVRADGTLAQSLGRAIAAVHDLPTAVVAEAGLPMRTASECADEVRALVRRADPLGAVPHELVHRWSAAAADPALWRFPPSVVHGSLAAECLLTAPRGAADERVTGVLGWSGLAIGDPARDLAWVIGLPREGAAAAVLAAYVAARPRAADPALPQRALLHAELELLRWLLHGIDGGDAAVVDDATGMLEALLATVLERTASPLGGERAAPLTVGEVERMLDARAHRATGARTPVAAHVARSSSAE